MENIKLVRFDKWCRECKFFKNKENEDPCWECLESPAKLNSTKPLRFKPGKYTNNSSFKLSNDIIKYLKENNINYFVTDEVSLDSVKIRLQCKNKVIQQLFQKIELETMPTETMEYLIKIMAKKLIKEINSGYQTFEPSNNKEA